MLHVIIIKKIIDNDKIRLKSPNKNVYFYSFHCQVFLTIQESPPSTSMTKYLSMFVILEIILITQQCEFFAEL